MLILLSVYADFARHTRKFTDTRHSVNRRFHVVAAHHFGQGGGISPPPRYFLAVDEYLRTRSILFQGMATRVRGVLAVVILRAAWPPYNMSPGQYIAAFHESWTYGFHIVSQLTYAARPRYRRRERSRRHDRAGHTRRQVGPVACHFMASRGNSFHIRRAMRCY